MNIKNGKRKKDYYCNTWISRRWFCKRFEYYCRRYERFKSNMIITIENEDDNIKDSIHDILPLNHKKNHDFEKEDLVICTDILGGSVNNGFVKFLGTYPFHLITNINLAFLIDLLLTTPTVSDNTLEMKTQEELFGVKYINKSIAFIPDEDDL